MKTIYIMGSGHVDLPKPKETYEQLQELLKHYISWAKEEYGDDVEVVVISGGANGVDRLWANAAMAMHVPVHVYIPFEYGKIFIKRANKWNPLKTQAERDESFKRHELMLAQVDKIINVGVKEGSYTRGDNNRRNDAMIEAATHHVVVSKMHPHTVLESRIGGGTNHAIRSMAKHGVEKIFWIDATNPTSVKLVSLQKEVDSSRTTVVNMKDARKSPQSNDVYIGRTKKGEEEMYGNPFSHKEGTLATHKVDTVEEAVEAYRKWLGSDDERAQKIMRSIEKGELTGKRLVCFCAPNPCHGDILAELANNIDNKEGK